MMLSTFTAFWAVSILFVITPGADWAYVISAGLHDRAVPPAVTGLLLGHLAATIIVATGVGAVVASTPAALTVLTMAGAVYLLWLGINVLAYPPVPSTCVGQESRPWLRWVARGVSVSGLNPKVFLLFLALLPQFIDPATGWCISAQVIALGLVHVLSCGVVYLLVGFGSQTVLRTRPQATRVVSRFSGLAMIAISMILLAGQLLS